MSEKLRWGLIGLGKITSSFVEDLKLVETCTLSSVASRSVDKARVFSEKYGSENYHASYSDLFADPDIDIVYIGTPHDSHAELSIEAMNNGKHVLCEKPLAVNSKQLEEMISAAKTNDVFLMEALWSRFNPSISEIINRVRSGDIGTVNYVNVDFSFAPIMDDDSRLFNPSLAGGSILDVGVYPLFLAYSTMGMPEKMLVTGKTHPTGVDTQMAAILEYESGVAQVMSGLKSKSDMVARICGDKGSFFISETWHETDSYTFLNNENHQREVIYNPRIGKGFTYEIEECVSCILNGRKQSNKWSWADSTNLITLTDEIRSRLGIIYPFE